MKTIRRFGMAAAACACISMVAPQMAYAATPASPDAAASPATPKDVALGPGGKLHGQVVDGQGVAQANTQVAVIKDSRLVTVVSSNDSGEFTVTELTGGVYQIGTQQGGGVYRLWSHRAAPPAADQSALVVADGQVVRGQDGSWLRFLANPWVLAGLVAAAIAIPLALDDDDAS